jgi:hypothetical protein
VNATFPSCLCLILRDFQRSDRARNLREVLLILPKVFEALLGLLKIRLVVQLLPHQQQAIVVFLHKKSKNYQR